MLLAANKCNPFSIIAALPLEVLVLIFKASFKNTASLATPEAYDRFNSSPLSDLTIAMYNVAMRTTVRYLGCPSRKMYQRSLEEYCEHLEGKLV